MSALTLLAFQNADVLRAVRVTPPAEIPTITALANLVGRDVSNFSKTLKLLSGSELIDVITSSPLEIRLTSAGDAALDALLRAEGDPAATPDGYVALTHAEIGPDPDNARTQSGLSDAEITQMAESLLDKGMLQSPGVRHNPLFGVDWLLTMGERRWRAWGQLIEQGHWPADKRIVCKIDESDDAGRLEAGLVENLQRSDLNNLEAGEGFLTLATRHDRTPDQIAKIIGKTPRYVQIAMKVAKEASPEDKARYVESERAYAHAKATGGEAKRTFTWENLRDEVREPKHRKALDKNGVITLIVVELAYRQHTEDHLLNAHGTWIEISTPPGGGHWAEAETLGLIEDHREEGRILARVTDKAEDWLLAQGFEADPDAMLARIRTEALGPMGERLVREEKRYATSFLNPPKPPPVVEPVFDEPEADDDRQAEAEFQEDMRQATRQETLSASPLPPARDSFAAQIRAVNADDQPATSPRLEEAMRQLIDTRVDPAAPPSPDLPHGPGFTNEEWIALVELAHKINVSPVEARGGSIIGATVGNYQSGPGAKAAQGLIHKRMLGFVQAPAGLAFIAYLTPAASEHFDEEVSLSVLTSHQRETLGDAACDALAKTGLAYSTPWLNAAPMAAAGEPLIGGSDVATDRIEIPIENWSREDGPGLELVDTTEALEAFDGKIPAADVDEHMRRCCGYLLVFAREADAIETHVAIGTKTEADELANVLMASGLYETVDLYVGGRTANAVCKSWTRQ